MQSKHLCGPVAGAVPQAGTSPALPSRLRGDSGGPAGLWEAGAEQGGCQTLEWLLVGHPPLPSCQPSSQQQGNCFQVLAQLAAARSCLTYQCCLALLAAIATPRSHTGTGVSLLPVQTKGQV